jgi:uncharacterized Fe-S radical SAM superfamily protein PflX
VGLEKLGQVLILEGVELSNDIYLKSFKFRNSEIGKKKYSKILDLT